MAGIFSSCFCDCNVTFGPPITRMTFVETDRERADRLYVECLNTRRDLADAIVSRDECRKTIYACVDAVRGANVVNRETLQAGHIGLLAKVVELRKIAEMSEHAESELRAEVETLRNELADVCGALASVTDRLAATAA